MKPCRGIPIGKPVKSENFVYGWYLKSIDNAHVIWFQTKQLVESGLREEIETHFYKVDPKTVGQQTGLCDKNGKDDYVGNIWEVEYRGKKHCFERKVTLDWDGYSFDFVCLTGNISSAHANVNEDGEIIGTIHDEEAKDG